LITSTIGALHGVGPDNSNLSPNYDPCSCLFGLLNSKTAAGQRESWRRLRQDFGQRLQQQREEISGDPREEMVMS